MGTINQKTQKIFSEILYILLGHTGHKPVTNSYNPHSITFL